MAMTKREVAELLERIIEKANNEFTYNQASMLLIMHHYAGNITEQHFLRLEKQLAGKWNKLVGKNDVFDDAKTVEFYCPCCGLRYKFDNPYFDMYLCPECKVQLKKDQ